MSSTPQPQVIQVWPEGVPGSDGPDVADTEIATPLLHGNLKIVRNTNKPTLTVYLPEPKNATGAAVIVCPGGGFHFHSIDMEGHDVARWLVARGIAAFVLKYRLVPTDVDEDGFKNQIADFRNRLGEIQKVIPHSVEDGRQAIRLVRQHAFGWAVDPDRIGILGFSAGGMVTSGVALAHDAASRPNFAAPIYGAPFEDVTAPADPPPLFLLVANDDRMAEQNIMRLYSAWNEAGASVELHVYSRGGHGFGMQHKGLPTDRWIERFADWLTAEGFVPAADRA